MGSMSSTETKRKKTNPSEYNKRMTWHYVTKVAGQCTVVCHKFFKAVFQVSNKRIYTIQQKVFSGVSVDDKRGRHGNRPRKIQADVWILLRMLC